RGAGHLPGHRRRSPRPSAGRDARAPDPRPAMSTVTLDPREERRALIVLLTVIYFMIAGFGLVIPLLPFFAQAFQASPFLVTAMFSVFSLGQFLGEPFWGKLSDRIGRRPVLIITISGVALSYAALAFAPNIWAALAI